MLGRRIAVALWGQLKSLWNERLKAYSDVSKARQWFEDNYDRIRDLFEKEHVRDVVFAPVKAAIRLTDATTDGKVRTTIASVALANAVMAGIPGRLGVGVFVSMALEAWMALSIARLVGVKVEKPTDIFTYLGTLAVVIGTIGWGFLHLLRFVFSLLILIPGVPATFVAELIVTNLIGVLFWVGFDEARSTGSFGVPKRMLGRVRRLTVELVRHQVKAVKGVLTPGNLRKVRNRIRAWLTGDIVLPEHAPAEAFVAGAFAALMREEYSELNGPLGEVFLQSIRDRWSRQLSDASVEEIAEYMTQYDTDQIVGVMNVIKGKMFEHLVEIHENADGDEWGATLHDDESYPGSDIVFTNLETGEQLEVSLKAVKDPSIIEHALGRYPDIPILTTSEMEGPFADLDIVATTDVSHDELSENANEIFEEMMAISSATAGRTETILGVGAGTAATGVAHLWPFVAAYLRGRISKDVLNTAFIKVLGDQGPDLARRVAMAAVFGPIYAWYLLARGIIGLTSDKPPLVPESPTGPPTLAPPAAKRLVYRPGEVLT
jgi:hypothetical protein